MVTQGVSGFGDRQTLLVESRCTRGLDILEGMAWDQIDSDMGSNRYMLLIIMIRTFFPFIHLYSGSANSLREFMTNCVV